MAETSDESRDTTGLATLAGHKGATIINDTDPHEILGSLIQFSSDAVVLVLKENGDAANIVSTYISTPANATGLNGITPMDRGEFSHIQLSAGSCTVVR